MNRTWLLPLGAISLLAGASTAQASWNNVFHLTCCDGPRARVSYSVPAGANCEPQARVSYIQRCYYQPETTYRRESYYVPVRENVKSYYYEPVTSYRYTSYYDPCTGCCERVAVPTTSFVMRERCTTVTRYVEQSRLVPVTTYRAVTMYTPVVTYYYPPVSDPASFKVPLAPPHVEEQRTPPATAPSSDEMIPPKNLPTNPQSNPRPAPRSAARPNAYTASRARAILRGELVMYDQTTPKPHTKVIFLNAADGKERVETRTDAYGNFDADLPPGEWNIYIGQGNGRASFHKTIQVKEGDVRDVMLVSR